MHSKYNRNIFYESTISTFELNSYKWFFVLFFSSFSQFIRLVQFIGYEYEELIV